MKRNISNFELKKGTFRKMNYNFEHGLVGMYRGTDIYVLSGAEWRALARSELIGNYYYAISRADDLDLILYKGVQKVGYLTPDGDIVLTQAAKTVVEEPKEVPKETPAAPAANDINLDALGFQVDDYLKRMDSQIIYKDLIREFDN